MTRRIVQFGTSRFLQAHAALFVHEAREAGQSAGPITVVQVSPSTERSRRVAAFGRAEGYPVVIRGKLDGAVVERTVTVKSVERGLSAHGDWQELVRLFASDIAFVISNTGDAGYQLSPTDNDLMSSARVPASFPGKLAALLAFRWQAGGQPIVVLPCELVSGNGQALRQATLRAAQDGRLPAAAVAWIADSIPFADSLVDRIVSEPIEPVGAIAEPYCLWAIRKAPGVRPPCEHQAIVMVDDLAPCERLKLFILNLGHTVLADLWLEQRRPSEVTVRAILEDSEAADILHQVYEREVVPGFAAHGMEAAARDYIATTLERFANPFLDHRIADIAQNHTAKVERRIAAFLAWSAEHGLQAGPVLGGIARRRAAAEASA